MENQIKCPKCGKVITNHPVIDAAANDENRGGTFITCECGEQISFWGITAQLREQQTTTAKFQRWLTGIFDRKAR